MNVSNSADLAEISEAAYADLNNVTTESQLRAALQAIGFSETQAKEFSDKWEVVHHQPETTSGFSATLFKSKDVNASQPFVLGVRGTQQIMEDLVITDGSDIVLDGLAIDQIVDMWSYWKRLITPKGASFVASELKTLDSETAALALAKAGNYVTGFGLTAELYMTWLHSRDDVIIDNNFTVDRVRTIEQVIPASNDPYYSGVLDVSLDPSQLLAVTGHSLGGHLSTALTRLVSGIEAQSINGAGFATGYVPGLSGDAELNIQNLS